MSDTPPTLTNLQQQINQLIPESTICPFAGTTCPRGWLFCDGSALDLVNHPEYATLAQILGSRYSPPGTQAPHVPDLRGRVIIGTGQGAGLTNRTLGTKGGSESHTLTVDQLPAHNHTLNLPQLNMRLPSPGTTGSLWLMNNQLPGGGNHEWVWPNGPANPGPFVTNTANAGGSQPHPIMQPFLTLNYIIKY